MRTIILLAVSLLAMSFSGCIDGDETGEPADESMEPTGNPQTGMNETVDENITEGPANPADAFVSVTPSLSEGDAPLQISFDLNGQQNESINYNISFGDGLKETGSTADFPLTVTHDFAYAGEYEVILTGEYVDEFGDFYQTDSIVFTLGGAPAPPGSGQRIGTETYTYDGTVALGIQHASCDVPDPAPPLNRETHDILIPDNYDGLSSFVSKFAVEFTNGPTAIDIDVSFVDPNGVVIATSSGFEVIDGDEAFTIEGNYGPGIYQMVINSCAAVNGEYSFTVAASYNVL